MRRPGRRAKSPLGISLFPFLAVLLCTMGSLIVLLICLVQRAGATPTPASAPIAAEIPPEDTSELENAIDDATFVASQLKGKKEELSKSLKSIRDEMAIAERILREQEDKAKDLQTELTAIRDGGGTSDALEAAKEAAEKVRAEVAELEAQLRKQKDSQATAPRRMSIVPYKGKNGTTQRPIYVECFRDRVVIQPEGIEFTSDDFLAAKSAGNPLDASLRAVREHFARKTDEKGQTSPYPLFIVRPGGDLSYLAARTAIVSWEDEFGYELIDESVELEFPPPDDQLASILKRAANDARKRQQALARALPGKFRSSSTGSSAEGGGSPNLRTAGGGLGGAGSGPSGIGLGAKPKLENAPKGIGGTDERFIDGVAQKGAKSSRFSDKTEATADSAGSDEAKGGSKSESKPLAHGSKKAGDKEGVPGGEGGAAASLAAAGEIQQRGKNWAHKAANSTVTPVTRSILVRCTGSQIIFIPPKGAAGKPIAIEWAGNPVSVVDSIALQVRNRINSWGMAINGGHWQPILEVEVTPDGEERFAELTAYFDQSGIEVRRRVR